MNNPISHLQIQSSKPFLRWAGGKNWLLKRIEPIWPRLVFNNYHEPFLGAGSFFFFLNTSTNSYLNDINEELIKTFTCVKNDVDSVISELKKFENTKAFYYKIRNTTFDTDIQQAARFIYLNQTSYNGIYRVNLRGQYNVPYGNRSKNFLDIECLKSANRALQIANLTSQDFYHCIDKVMSGDLVFLDPPYTISHNNNGFLKYNKKLFSLEDQYRLSAMIDEIKKKDAFYILTNAAHWKIKEIFDKNDNFTELERASLVGGKHAKRTLYKEMLVSNIKMNF